MKKTNWCKPFRILPLMLMVLIFGSCSPYGYLKTVAYTVINTTDGRIKVNFNGLIRPPTYYFDTIVYVDRGSSKVLFLLAGDNSRPSTQEVNDTLRAIKVLKIYREDTVASTTNFRLTKYWHYNTISEQECEENLVVSNTDFPQLQNRKP
jgi:hypothetical protein